MGGGDSAARSLPAIVGNMYVPVWALRPGSYAVLEPLASAMPLWLVMYSWTDDAWRPLYASQETLAATIGVSRASVTRRLRDLREASLLFEVDRGWDPKLHQQRAVARWALDPFAGDVWRDKVEEALARVAEEDGKDGHWFHNATTSLDAFDRRSFFLAQGIAEDMPVIPRLRRRKRRKGPAAHSDPRGEVFSQGGGTSVFEPSNTTDRRKKARKNRARAKNGERDTSAKGDGAAPMTRPGPNGGKGSEGAAAQIEPQVLR